MYEILYISNEERVEEGERERERREEGQEVEMGDEKRTYKKSIREYYLSSLLYTISTLLLLPPSLPLSLSPSLSCDFSPPSSSPLPHYLVLLF